MADVTTTFAAKDESFAKTVENLQQRLTGLEADVKGFNEKVASIASGFTKWLGPIAAAAAAFVGLKNVADTFFSAISKAGELNDLSARTGESAGNLAILQRAFENAGASAGAVGPMINRLQRFIVEAGDASSSQAEALDTLGLSFTDLSAKSPLEQMQALATAISGIEDPATRTKLAMDIFGRSGGELMPLLRAMGVELNTARAQLGAYPEALNLANAALDTVGDNFTAIKNKGVEFATGLLVNVAPALAEVTSKIAEIDAARLGMILSEHLHSFLKAADGALNFTKNLDAVKIAIQGMADGQISEGLSLMFVTAKIQALSLVNEFVKSFVAGLQTIGQFFGDMFASNGALVHLLTTVFGMIGDKLTANLSRALATIFDAIPFFGDEVAESLRYSAETAERSFGMAMKGLGAQVDLVGDQLFEAGAAMPEAFANNRSKLQPMFDLKPLLAEQAQYTQNIQANLSASGKSAGDVASNMGQAADKSGKFADDVATAKGDVKAAVDFTTGPGGIADAAKDAAQKTSEGAGKLTKAFDGATQVGANFEKAVKQSANDFYKVSVDAGRTFKQEVIGGLKFMTDSFRGIATEGTLKRAVASLERLERKLPQPVLT